MPQIHADSGVLAELPLTRQAVDMSEQLLDGQIAYYRERAAEYDASAYPAQAPAAERIRSIVTGLAISGEVLELACGTGMWTSALAERARHLTAIDTSPEAIGIARRRCPHAVHFEVADVFSWQPPTTFDVIVFAFWLSHVPYDRREHFFTALRQWLRPSGRVVLVDEPPAMAEKETLVADGIAQRSLANGTRHRIVKVFVDPRELSAALGRLGWRSAITQRGEWVIGQAWPL
jgi:demethylmenaquinone methyltransferase/2-methoxy-6-polyprenyl-1,4-benzoquinol methylase